MYEKFNSLNGPTPTGFNWGSVMPTATSIITDVSKAYVAKTQESTARRLAKAQEVVAKSEEARAALYGKPAPVKSNIKTYLIMGAIAFPVTSLILYFALRKK